MNKLVMRDIIYLVTMLVVIIGVFILLIMDIDVPSWLIGAVGSLISGVLGINVGNTKNG